MTRTGHSNLLSLDPEIERTIRRLQQKKTWQLKILMTLI